MDDLICRAIAIELNYWIRKDSRTFVVLPVLQEMVRKRNEHRWALSTNLLPSVD